MTTTRIVTKDIPRTGIKKIDCDSVRFIAAGERISDIVTAIKELVENSIDAKAKNIEVRLGKFGIDCIEVEDNGCGIEEEDFDTLALRYHTSKINDLYKLKNSLETFGFRGEALCCLCSIANVTITTKTFSSPCGTKLTFRNDGFLLKKEPIARDLGTTVIIKNLFHSMPVRRRELETTAKRQYDKVVKLLYEQVLARPHIKFTLCKKFCVKKDKDIWFGGTTLRDTLITIFSSKVFESLLVIKKDDQSADLNKIGTQNNHVISMEIDDEEEEADTTKQCNLSTKSVTHNETISNGLFNESNGNEMKREILDEQPIRQEFYKRTRKSKFAREKPVYSVSGYISKIGCGRHSNDCQFMFVNKKPCEIPKLSRLINDIYRNCSNGQHPFYCIFIQVQPWAADFNVPRKRAVILQEENKLCEMVSEILEKLYSPTVPGNHSSCPAAHIPIKEKKGKIIEIDLSKDEDKETTEDTSILIEMINGKERSSNPVTQPKSTIPYPNTIIPNPEKQNGFGEASTSGYNKSSDRFTEHSEEKRSTPILIPSNNADSDIQITNQGRKRKRDRIETDYFGERNILPIDKSELFHSPKKNNNVPSRIVEPSLALVPWEVDLMNYKHCRYNQRQSLDNKGKLQAYIDQPDDLGIALERERAQREIPKDSKEFSFAIHPNFNTVAEQELKFNLNKSSFEDMQILDQHATDERANYEEETEQNPFIKQDMVCPKPLYLNLIQENAIMDNLDYFKAKGFEFSIDKTKLVGFRVLLRSTSVCKGQGIDECLTKEDVEELINVILESPNSLKTYILKKVKNVAATRACRKSVMIGDALSWNQMEEIVRKMSRLQNPWVCAHNRPTIRHLMDTDWMASN